MKTLKKILSFLGALFLGIPPQEFGIHPDDEDLIEYRKRVKEIEKDELQK